MLSSLVDMDKLCCKLEGEGLRLLPTGQPGVADGAVLPFPRYHAMVKQTLRGLQVLLTVSMIAGHNSAKRKMASGADSSEGERATRENKFVHPRVP